MRCSQRGCYVMMRYRPRSRQSLATCSKQYHISQQEGIDYSHVHASHIHYLTLAHFIETSAFEISMRMSPTKQIRSCRQSLWSSLTCPSCSLPASSASCCCSGLTYLGTWPMERCRGLMLPRCGNGADAKLSKSMHPSSL